MEDIINGLSSLSFDDSVIMRQESKINILEIEKFMSIIIDILYHNCTYNFGFLKQINTKILEYQEHLVGTEIYEKIVEFNEYVYSIEEEHMFLEDAYDILATIYKFLINL